MKKIDNFTETLNIKLEERNFIKEVEEGGLN